ncbi:MAG: hypothetical protein AAFX87_06525 [Bacteroidota bacterium]
MMIEMLRESWFSLADRYSGDGELKTELFDELVSYYSHKSRHYHGLTHINNLLRLTEEYQEHLSQRDQVLWAIWYHDAIYNVRKGNNEEKSAELSMAQLDRLGLSQEVLTKISDLILATKSHVLAEDSDFDTAFMLDIDLSILGSNEADYKAYTKQIRKEYRIYPDFMYRKGRKKVLHSFLEQERIFKTDLFYPLWEDQARANLGQELNDLA